MSEVVVQELSCSYTFRTSDGVCTIQDLVQHVLLGHLASETGPAWDVPPGKFHLRIQLQLVRDVENA